MSERKDEPFSHLTISRANLLEDGSDAPFRQLVQDMLSMSARLQSIRDRFGAIAGVTGPQYSMMITIAHLQANGIPVTVGKLGAYLHVSATFVTAESKKLARAGFIRKDANPSDRRSVVLSLTGSGTALIESVRGIVRTANDEIFRTLSSQDFAIMRRIMAELVESLDDALRITEAIRPL